MRKSKEKATYLKSSYNNSQHNGLLYQRNVEFRAKNSGKKSRDFSNHRKRLYINTITFTPTIERISRCEVYITYLMLHIQFLDILFMFSNIRFTHIK